MRTEDSRFFQVKTMTNAAETEVQDSCMKVGCKEVDISLPIELKPDTDIGKIEIHCCGEPRIECVNEPCDNGVLIEIRQRAKVIIPVKFNVKAAVKDSSIECVDKDCKE